MKLLAKLNQTPLARLIKFNGDPLEMPDASLFAATDSAAFEAEVVEHHAAELGLSPRELVASDGYQINLPHGSAAPLDEADFAALASFA